MYTQTLKRDKKRLNNGELSPMIGEVYIVLSLLLGEEGDFNLSYICVVLYLCVNAFEMITFFNGFHGIFLSPVFGAWRCDIYYLQTMLY